MPVEELLIRWTVRLSLLLYAAALAAILTGRSRPNVLREARLTWTAGCVLLWVHLAAAFHFYHGWSHEAAYEATARDTESSVGWAFGGGVYFNYLFAVIWTLHVMYWWKCGIAALARPGRWQCAVHGFMFFMVFNATVTFVDGALRWVAVGLFAALGMIAIVSRRSVGRGDALVKESK